MSILQRESDRIRTPAPLVPFFVAVVCGIFWNARATPGFVFWQVLFALSLSCFALTKFARSTFSEERRQRFDALEPRHVWSEFYSVFAYGSFWIYLAVACVAGMRHEYYYNVFPNDHLAFLLREERQPATLELRVLKTPIAYENTPESRSFGEEEVSTSFIAEALRAAGDESWEPVSGKVAVTVNGDSSLLKIGDRIRSSGLLSRPSAPSNPGDRDMRFYYRSQRVLNSFYIKNVEHIVDLTNEKDVEEFRIERFLERLRLRGAAVIRENLSPRNAAVAVGMTFGFRNEVDQETNDAFRRTGTAHLLAISGLHVALIIGAFSFILRRFHIPAGVVAALTLALAFFYLGLTDMRAPATRAVVLTAVFCIGGILNRRGVTINSLALAAVVLLMRNPCELFQLGAQLSFLATGTFLWFSSASTFRLAQTNIERRKAIRERAKQRERDEKELEKIKSKLEKEHETRKSPWDYVVKPIFRRLRRAFLNKCKELFKTGFVVWGVSSPLVASATHLFTPIAILANPIVWAPATVALLLAFLLAFSGLLGDAVPFIREYAIPYIGALTNGVFNFFLGALDRIASTSYGAFYIPTLKTSALWILYAPLVFWTIFPHTRPRRRVLAVGFLLWLVVVASTRYFDERDTKRAGRLVVDVYSVGHGLASACYFPDGRVALYDCGSMTNAQRAGEIVANNLWNMGKTRVDLVIISHSDFDHFGALETLLKYIDVKRVCVSPATFSKENVKLSSLRDELERRNIPIDYILAGETLERFGFPEIEILHPTETSTQLEADKAANALSVVASLRYMNRSFLFPGDLDSEEAAFLETSPRRYDMALAPHHGGKTVNFDDFFEWSDPKWVVLSGGGFLRGAKTEKTLREQGRVLFHTFDDGAVRFVVERDPRSGDARGKATVKTYKSRRSLEDGTAIATGNSSGPLESEESFDGVR